MQRRMIDALQAFRVESVGLADTVPLGEGQNGSSVFTDNTSDLRPSNSAADAIVFKISPEYLHAAGTALLLGGLYMHDDKDARA